MAKFIQTEQHIISLFEHCHQFNFDGQQYTVENVGKPRPSEGECKTDVYVAAVDKQGCIIEIKISIKQTNADFVENKITLQRAIEIFGEDAKNVIRRATESIADKFVDDYLVCIDSYRRTSPGSFKLGWKFELLNKLSGEKSGVLDLTDRQKIGVFSGENLSIEKRNCKVNGITIVDSGVANFVLETDGSGITLQQCLKQIVPVNKYALSQNIYFACKALNYRFYADKWDGDRPLAVYVKWFVENGKIFGSIIQDQPFVKRGNCIGNSLKRCIAELGLSNAPLEEIVKHVDTNVRIYKK